MPQTEEEQRGPKGSMPCLEYWFSSITGRDGAQQKPTMQVTGVKLESLYLMDS